MVDLDGKYIPVGRAEHGVAVGALAGVAFPDDA
jgi:hypothetical protein